MLRRKEVQVARRILERSWCTWNPEPFASERRARAWLTPGYLPRVPTWPITEPFAPALRRTFASFNAAAINTSISAMSEISGTWLATSCFGRRFSASAAFGLRASETSRPTYLDFLWRRSGRPS